MPIIELIGVDFENKGACLMLSAVREALDRELSEYQLAIAPTTKVSVAQIYSLGALRKLQLNRFGSNLLRGIPGLIRKIFLKRRIVFEQDIRMVLDLSGFAYGDPWPVRRLLYNAAYAERMASRPADFVILPQALGPFNRDDVRPIATRLLNNATIICARDKSSLNNCQPLVADTSHLRLTPDITFDLTVTDVPTIPGNMGIIPNSKMLTHTDANSNWQARYQNVLLELIQLGQQMNLKPFLLNHEGDADRQICQMLSQQFNPPLPIVEQDDALEIKGIINQADLVISSRYHGCVSALSCQTPVMATSWSHKYQELFAEFGMNDYIISPDESIADWQHKIATLLSAPPDTSGILANHKSAVRQMWQSITAIIKK